MINQIPKFLHQILSEQYNEDEVKQIINGYSVKRPVTLRTNTLKSNIDRTIQELTKAKIQFEQISWNKEAFILKNIEESKVRELEIYKNGEIYLQSLSSMIPAIIMQPKEGENILDMAAAPGGKTTQMSALSSDKALITACEKNKIRAERLRYNIEKQGANKVNILNQDARDLDNYFAFDKILLDAPCSGSGTIELKDIKTQKYFTEELIKRSVKTQQELLKKALDILKPGHEMVYSTCSIISSENEENIERILKIKKAEIIPINEEMFKNIPQLPTKIKGTICICPSKLYEGFFIAKIKAKN